jgi:putative transposase
MNECIQYYHEDRTHLGLGKQTPARRAALKRAKANSTIVSMPRLGGLHHRYKAAA